MHAMVVHMKMSFFKIFSYFIGFYPNFQIFCPFLLFFFFFAVSEKLHTCPYYPEEALATLGQNGLRCLMMCDYWDHSRHDVFLALPPPERVFYESFNGFLGEPFYVLHGRTIPDQEGLGERPEAMSNGVLYCQKHVF